MNSPARFRVLACGRRWGKTELGKVAVIDAARQGAFCWWVSPTYGMADEVWRSFKDSLNGLWGDKDETRHRLILPGGGVIAVRSAHEPDALRGVGLNLAVLDEAAFMPEEVWTGAIRPALSDKSGRALLLSTPQGHNWFYRLFRLGLDPLQSEWASFHYPTSSNPLIPPGEIEAAREELPERWFRQEYEAAFVEDAGAVFRRIDKVCSAQPEEPQPGHSYLMGVDLARSVDFSVCAVFDVTATGGHAAPPRMVFMDRFNRLDWSLQIGRIKALAERYSVRRIVIDQTGVGDPVVEQLRRELANPTP